MPVAVQLAISLQVSLGPPGGSNRSLLNFTEATSTTAEQGNVAVVQIANSATNDAINLATLFPSLSSAKVITLRDVSATAREVSFSPANSGTKLVLAAGGSMVLRTNGTLPTLYFDNSSGGAADIEITAAG